ncbi:MAG TPA: hypothetical protein VFG05_00815 [Methylocella sp.]|nr:hypothetical protein [Methylocella sp.]
MLCRSFVSRAFELGEIARIEIEIQKLYPPAAPEPRCPCWYELRLYPSGEEILSKGWKGAKSETHQNVSRETFLSGIAAKPDNSVLLGQERAPLTPHLP